MNTRSRYPRGGVSRVTSFPSSWLITSDNFNIFDSRLRFARCLSRFLDFNFFFSLFFFFLRGRRGEGRLEIASIREKFYTISLRKEGRKKEERKLRETDRFHKRKEFRSIFEYNWENVFPGKDTTPVCREFYKGKGANDPSKKWTKIATDVKIPK